MTLSNLELVILSYISRHPMTRRSTIIDALSYDDWSVGHRIRVALDTLSAQHIIEKHGEGRRNIRYSVPQKEERISS